MENCNEMPAQGLLGDPVTDVVGQFGVEVALEEGVGRLGDEVWLELELAMGLLGVELALELGVCSRGRFAAVGRLGVELELELAAVGLLGVEFKLELAAVGLLGVDDVLDEALELAVAGLWLMRREVSMRVSVHVDVDVDGLLGDDMLVEEELAVAWRWGEA